MQHIGVFAVMLGKRSNAVRGEKLVLVQHVAEHAHELPAVSQRASRGVRRLLSLVNRRQCVSVLRYMLDENEFLSPHGIRALSKHHREHPYVLHVNGHENRVDYEPAESTTGLFGGNSNWRGPVWFPMNFLLIESLQKFHHYFGDCLKVELP